MRTTQRSIPPGLPEMDSDNGDDLITNRPEAEWDALPPRTKPTHSQRWIQFASVAALFTSAAAVGIMIIGTFNKTMTGAGVAFYVISLMLFLSCAGSGYAAEKRRNSVGAVVFAMTNGALFVVFFAFFIHDGADKKCSDNVWQLQPCTVETTHNVSCGDDQESITIVIPGAPQVVELLVIKYLIALCLFTLFTMAGIRRSREMKFSMDALSACLAWWEADKE